MPNGPYYRLRAEYFPLSDAGAKPTLKTWIALFRMPFLARVTVPFGCGFPMKRLSLPRDDDGYLFIDSPIAGPALVAVTPFMLRNNDDNVEIRLDTERGDDARSGLFPSLCVRWEAPLKRRALEYQSVRRGSRTAVRCSPARTRFSRSVIFLDALSVRYGLGWRHVTVCCFPSTPATRLLVAFSAQAGLGRTYRSIDGSRRKRTAGLIRKRGRQVSAATNTRGGLAESRFGCVPQCYRRAERACGHIGSRCDGTCVSARYDEAAAEDAICGDVQLTRPWRPPVLLIACAVDADMQTTEETKTVENGAASAAVSEQYGIGNGIETPSTICLPWVEWAESRASLQSVERNRA